MNVSVEHILVFALIVYVFYYHMDCCDFRRVEGVGHGGRCNDGYHLDSDNQCRENICTCDNGPGATGAECSTHNAEICAEPSDPLQSGCNTNYYYSGGACYPQLDQGEACGAPHHDKRCKSYDSLGENACIECRSYWPHCHGGTTSRGYWCQ